MKLKREKKPEQQEKIKKVPKYPEKPEYLIYLRKTYPKQYALRLYDMYREFSILDKNYAE